jgi:tRNA threonylcarbamoyladenosine biosynthesis protein TsaE
VDARGVKVKTKAAPAPGALSAPGPRTVYSLSEDETFDFGRGLGRALKGGELLLLEGDLGYGKTVLARGVAAALGIPPEEVSSPSFTLIHEYKGGRIPMFHLDLYRLDAPEEEVGALGLEDIRSAGGVVLVEWGERLPPFLRRGATTIRFHDVGEGSRRIEILAEGTPGQRPRGDA